MTPHRASPDRGDPPAPPRRPSSRWSPVRSHQRLRRPPPIRHGPPAGRHVRTDLPATPPRRRHCCGEDNHRQSAASSNAPPCRLPPLRDHRPKVPLEISRGRPTPRTALEPCAGPVGGSRPSAGLVAALLEHGQSASDMRQTRRKRETARRRGGNPLRTVGPMATPVLLGAIGPSRARRGRGPEPQTGAAPRDRVAGRTGRASRSAVHKAHGRIQGAQCQSDERDYHLGVSEEAPEC
jgi:hypothetical protein